jgi:Protein of unknown function (DUF2950)
MIVDARAAGLRLALGGLLMVPAMDAAIGQAQQTFSTPEAAMAALLDALSAQDDDAVLAIFGAEYGDAILGEDPDAARDEQARFVAAADQSLELRPDGQDRRIAYVGPRAWPLPIPSSSRVEFGASTPRRASTSSRTSGSAATSCAPSRPCAPMWTCRTSMRASIATATRCWSTRSTSAAHPAKRNGLYWPAGADEAPSPIGPLLAAAVEARDAGDSYNGYHYRILTGQGPNPPGGAYDYVINGNMIAGFALVAWPADYDHSGIMTFVVSHQGKVYEKDLGPETAEVVAAIDAYDPDPTWTEVTE